VTNSTSGNSSLYTGYVPILWRPFRQFASLQTASGILLILSTLAALVWANSPWGATYEACWHTPVSIKIGPFGLEWSLAHWINDGLMAVFFLLVGLEIKRELIAGELADFRRALLPILAAVGGMVVPAGIYAAFNLGTDHANGWGIPMATDIAFALGALSLLGNRVPLSLKVFLAALAIIDDIGAVLVIAFFYTAKINWVALACAGGIVVAIIGLSSAKVRRPLPYLFAGVLLWLAFVSSGVHASIAGVVLAFLIPHHSELDERAFPAIVSKTLGIFSGSVGRRNQSILDDARIGAIHSIEQACEDVEPCLQRLERGLHPWVSYLILPVFALANAGIVFDRDILHGLGSPLSLGIMVGLMLGKPIGILVFSITAVRLRWAGMPTGSTLVQMLGVGVLGGIGFTMSIFIAGLAFNDPSNLAQAKLGILAASLAAGIAGYLVLRFSPSPRR
jgi:Na+:H+ antiporter, NhaA family